MTDNNNNHKLLLDGTITTGAKKMWTEALDLHSNNKSSKILIYSDIGSQRVLYTFIIIVIITIIITLRHVCTIDVTQSHHLSSRYYNCRRA